MGRLSKREIEIDFVFLSSEGRSGLVLTHIWFKGPMHLALGMCPCPAETKSNTRRLISKIRRLVCVCARLCAIYLSIRRPHGVSMHDTTDK